MQAKILPFKGRLEHKGTIGQGRRIGWLDMLVYRLFHWRWDSLLRERPDVALLFETGLREWRQQESGRQARGQSANMRWLREHAGGEYAGRWVALRDGVLLGSADDLQTLTTRVTAGHGVTFPSREVMAAVVD